MDKQYFTEQKRFFQSELFSQVQLEHLFTDSKTFADAEPKGSLTNILAAYEEEKQNSEFCLRDFVTRHFILPSDEELKADRRLADVSKQIKHLWQVLRKPADVTVNDSLIALPFPYTVPGGRFREIYYWDSYFAALGLISAERTNDLIDLVENFISLQTRVGLIPNGNRWYYATRSQPPVLAMLVNLLSQEVTLSDEQQKRYLKAIETEYLFWMDGAQRLKVGEAYRRVVRLDDHCILNRYYDDEATPRPESYAEDIELAQGLSDTDKQNFYRNVRAACESGWDFSSRWFDNPDDIQSIATTEIIPIDLNCLLYFTENYLANAFQKGDNSKGKLYSTAAKNRAVAIEQWLWCENDGLYLDYWFEQQTLSQTQTLASLWPLYFNLASTQQAMHVKQIVESRFLKKGGLITTSTTSSQQWDAPNGWAPLHWVAINGLSNYGYKDLADIIATRWLDTVTVHYQATGVFMEKYNVVNTNHKADGGEYEVQEGFGWTNGVTAALIQRR